MGPIGIFGGTFDPIHYGHLRTALELQEMLDLASVHFVPAATPPHRETPMTDGKVRMRLVKAAIRGEKGFVADDRELRRAGPSYTIDTLASFRAEFPRRSLCLLLGMDAFLGLPAWHRWRELLDLAHVVVAHRPGWRAPRTGTLGRLLRERGTSERAALRASRRRKEPAIHATLNQTACQVHEVAYVLPIAPCDRCQRPARRITTADRVAAKRRHVRTPLDEAAHDFFPPGNSDRLTHRNGLPKRPLAVASDFGRLDHRLALRPQRHNLPVQFATADDHPRGTAE